MADTLTRLASALGARYQIESELGAGGMATVYLAHDVKHDRKVAMKVLRPELAAIVGAERFLNEIKVTANLQHPHILPLHDSGEAEGFLFYVMPYVEGESLRDKLNREGELSIEESLEIGQAVAGALDYAHRHDVIHRDIKPENILLHDGQPVVADFGISLAVSQAGGSRLTETGLSLGTPHYMSPEQAMGDREITARTDLYSLACVLYEMLAGEPPYTGPSAQSIVAKVLTEKAPSLTDRRDTVPPHVAASIDKCLSKLPADRFASAAQFAQALGRPSAVAPTTAVIGREARPAAAARDWRLPAALASTAVFAGLFMVTALRGPTTTGPEPYARFTLSLPYELGAANGRLVAISPDGSRIVYVGRGAGGRQLYSRRLGALEVEPVSGTEGAAQPFFSPDGRWIGFLAGGGVIRRVPAAGGPAIDVLRSPRTGVSGPSWGDDGTIVFTVNGELYRMNASGGEAERISVESDEPLYWPQILPGGGAALVSIGQLNVTARVGLVDLTTGELSTLIPNGGGPRYLTNGYLVYGDPSGALLAVEFDVRRRTVSSEPQLVLDRVAPTSGTTAGLTQIAVSNNGTMVYLEAETSGSEGALVLSDLAGDEEVLPIEDGGQPRFSPTGDRLAFVANGHLYVYDLTLGTSSQLTFTGVSNFMPTWSPDGQYIAFTSLREGSDDFDIYRRRADGRGNAERLTAMPYPQGPRLWFSDWRMLTVEINPESEYDLEVLDTTGTMTPYLTHSWNEAAPTVSPDERWVAYVSNEAGEYDVYVSAFPEGGGRWQISQDGGTDPYWADQRTIYYLHDGDLYAADVRTEPAVSVVQRRRVLPGPFRTADRFSNVHGEPGGGRLVLVRPKVEQTVREVTVVTNWFEEMRERMGN